MKTCARGGACCAPKNPQILDNFARCRNHKDGLTSYCKSCLKQYREQHKAQRHKVIQRWRIANKDKMRQYRANTAVKNGERTKKWREKNLLRVRYGITNEIWGAMFDSQNGCCAVCSAHASQLSRGLAVDHCHTSGRFRGLLCHMCNQAIGLFKDSPERLTKACEYLRR